MRRAGRTKLTRLLWGRGKGRGRDRDRDRGRYRDRDRDRDRGGVLALKTYCTIIA